MTIEDTEKARKIIVTPDNGAEPIEHAVSKKVKLEVEEGEHVKAGTKLTAGVEDPKQILRVMTPRDVQQHLVDQVQAVYRPQGVSIHDKHIEVIVRQMLKRVTIIGREALRS